MTRAAALSLILVLLGAFALANWDAFTTASTLSVGVASFQAPLGLQQRLKVLVLVEHQQDVGRQRESGGEFLPCRVF